MFIWFGNSLFLFVFFIWFCDGWPTASRCPVKLKRTFMNAISSVIVGTNTAFYINIAELAHPVNNNAFLPE